jgi:hypothetical protein
MTPGSSPPGATESSACAELPGLVADAAINNEAKTQVRSATFALNNSIALSSLVPARITFELAARR